MKNLLIVSIFCCTQIGFAMNETTESEIQKMFRLAKAEHKLLSDKSASVAEAEYSFQIDGVAHVYFKDGELTTEKEGAVAFEIYPRRSYYRITFRKDFDASTDHSPYQYEDTHELEVDSLKDARLQNFVAKANTTLKVITKTSDRWKQLDDWRWVKIESFRN